MAKQDVAIKLSLDIKSGEGFPDQKALLDWISGCLNCNTNHVAVEVQAFPQSAQIHDMRQAGNAVVIFGLNELGTVRSHKVEDRLVELGNEVISDLGGPEVEGEGAYGYLPIEPGSPVDVEISAAINALRRSDLEATAEAICIGFGSGIPTEDLQNLVLQSARSLGGLRIFHEGKSYKVAEFGFAKAEVPADEHRFQRPRG